MPSKPPTRRELFLTTLGDAARDGEPETQLVRDLRRSPLRASRAVSTASTRVSPQPSGLQRTWLDGGELDIKHVALRAYLHRTSAAARICTRKSRGAVWAHTAAPRSATHRRYPAQHWTERSVRTRLVPHDPTQGAGDHFSRNGSIEPNIGACTSARARCAARRACNSDITLRRL
jgi:hypothetical protein